MTIASGIDGALLDDPDGRWYVLDETDVINGIAANAVSQTIPGVDGATPVVESLGEPVKTFVMLVVGATDLDLRKNVAALMTLFRNGTELARNIDDDVLTTPCRFKEAQRPEYAPDGTAKVTVTLRLPKVYWRGASADWSKTSAVSGTAYEVTTLANSTAPVGDGRLLITGPADAGVKITDVASGAWASFGAGIAAGSKVLFDCNNWLVYQGTGVSLDGGGSGATGQLTTSGGPYLLRVTPVMKGSDPAVTWARVKLTGTGFTSATGVSVRAQPAHIV